MNINPVHLLQFSPRLIVSKPYEQVICVTEDYSLLSDGEILSVRVQLKNVDPCRTIMVGVVIYKDNELYAHRVKKIFTYYNNINTTCNCPRCYRIIPRNHRLSRYCMMKHDICVDGFNFLFSDSNYQDQMICIKAYAHYIY